MIVATDPNVQQYQEMFSGLEDRLGEANPWLASVRRDAFARFTEFGFPTTQHEEWRFTNLKALAQTRFALATVPASLIACGPSTSETLYETPTGHFGPADVEPLSVGGTDFHRLVFLNGTFLPDLSRTARLPKGVTLTGLAQNNGAGPILKRHLTHHADFAERPFAALNTALFNDGALLHLPKGTVLERPIQFLFVSTANGEPTVTCPRVLIVAEERTQATIVESYASLGDGAHFTNAVTEIVAADNAVIDHYRDQRENEAASHISLLRLHQQRDSNVTSHALTTGGGLVRNDVHVVLDGENCNCTLNGLFLTHNTQHVDNHLRVEHAQPHCNSWEFYKGILDGKSSGVFTGRIFVHKAAQKTDAKQSNNNLLLSPDATIDTKPQLEIFADDVRCTHGATIGQVDADAIFYLRTRGVPEAAARSMLIYAFAGESLGQIKVEPLRDQFQRILLERLPHGELLRSGSPLFYGADFAQQVRAADRRREH